ncbi:MAG: hypothetical protein WBQ08_11130 [Candidatus Sulfotelmatobacter sp.]
MFQPHSLLWHYLWFGPCVLLLLLAVVIYRRSLHKEFPFFLTFVIFQGVTVLALYVLDLTLPPSRAAIFWHADFVRSLFEVVLKFALLGEIFSKLLKLFPALSQLGTLMIRVVGPALVLAATLLVALSRPSDLAPIVANSLRLDLADFVIECGLLLFIFLFAAYFHLGWEHLALGIAVGRGLAASVQLVSWAVEANLTISIHQRVLLGFVNTSVYHLSVLIWFYYVLTTPKVTLIDNLGEGHDNSDDRDLGGPHSGGHDSSGQDSSEEERQHDLVVWNRELERLLRR